MARVLIVDDKEQDRYLLQVLLEKSGYEIEAAANGEHALAMARRKAPELIVSDILMPLMDGFNLCREWRKDPELSGVPFVFYTATYTDPRDEEFAVSLGADLFIVKPVEPADLLKTLKEVLDRGGGGRVARKKPVEREEAGYFKEYSEVLVRKLEDKLELFRAVFHAEPGVILVLSESGDVSEINCAAQALLGVSPEEVLDKPFIDRFIAEAHREAFAEQFRTVLRGESVRGYECDVLCPDGAGRIIVWNGERLVRSSGAVEGALMIGADITRQRETERQLLHAQKMEALGTFASGIAHDFNNILSAVMGHVDMALHASQQGGADVARGLRKALAASQRAAELAGQILAFSRRSERRREPVDVARVAREAVKLIRAAIPAAIEIEVRGEEHCGTVAGFAVEIHQIVVNLCTNGFHAIGGRPGRITVGCGVSDLPGENRDIRPALPAGRYVVLEVGDTGSGMNEETVGRIFDPYFTTKEAGTGTGLGLAVVNSIAESHGGGISVESAPGRGSTFRVYFPRMPAAPTKAEEPAPERIDRGRERVLLVEDEATNRSVFALMLESLGYRLVEASDGAEALEVYRRAPATFDCVVTDLNMPRMGGDELCRTLRAEEPRLPFVVLSGSTVSGEDLGISEEVVVLGKPLRIAELSRAVREALDRAR